MVDEAVKDFVAFELQRIFFVCVCGDGYQTQGLTHARHVTFITEPHPCPNLRDSYFLELTLVF